MNPMEADRDGTASGGGEVQSAYSVWRHSSCPLPNTKYETRTTPSGIRRRELLQIAGAGTFALLVPPMPVMAGPFTASERGKEVPVDKKLHPEWVKSLFERGAPAVSRGAELDKIGMPVGGIGAGQLYLGGDGKLWQWDIFNQHLSTGDGHYAAPPLPASPLEQGFALEIAAGGKTETRPLDRSGFADIRFRGEYPIGTVEYADAASPVAVTLEAFSPFIPLATDDSSLPATILHFTLRNTTNEPVELTLTGRLENAVCRRSPGAPALRRSRVVHGRGFSFLDCSVEKIAFTDRPGEAAELGEMADYGTMGLALLGAPPAPGAAGAGDTSVPLAEKLVGSIGRKLRIDPGEARSVTFVVAWHFPNLEIERLGKVGRHYATRFDSALAVAQYVADHFERLSSQTRLWRDTWYDSTLPYWFLDRTFLTSSVLATSTCYRLADGRFYAWEGVGCCAGTCTHVWHYAQAVARLFPDLERDTRERVDFGLAFHPDTGVIGFRAEFDPHLAVDGQAGTILRAYREHQMSPDDAFLKRNWPRIKKAFDPLLQLDGDDDGVLEGAQMNTLDQPWYGEIAWLSSLYLAALRAGEAMAGEMGEEGWGLRCRAIAERGARNIDAKLFNGEYYIQRPDAAHAKSVGSHDGCEIDQVFGESWARQVGLGRLLPEPHVQRALASLWKYNFTPDVGPFRAAHKPGRWFAMAGEGGLLMCSWPKGESARVSQGFDFYFNECMTGFEYQVAGHMLGEGMLLEGLAVTRAIHDRYHPSRRNPWNEVECGDHYARSMASYGVFLAACGYEHHGPNGHLGFAPRLTPENFKAAFTTAEGWGSFSQKVNNGKLQAEIALHWGQLRLKTLALQMPPSVEPGRVRVTLAGRAIPSTRTVENNRLTLTMAADVMVKAGQKLEIRVVRAVPPPAPVS